MDISILFEDKDCVVINKPAGLVVHADGRTEEATLVDWIMRHYPDIKEVGEPWTKDDGEVIYRPGIVHRIDRDTSGILIIAKNQEMFDSLKAQFKNREVEKVYNAFVYGAMKESEGTVDRPIGRSSKDFRLWSAQRGSRGMRRDAVTEYKALSKSTDFTYVEARPKTGRTHQIRVHFKAINHPIVYDSLYAPKREGGLGFNRLALHSSSITFTMLNGSRKTVVAPLPEDFVEALKQLKEPNEA